MAEKTGSSTRGQLGSLLGYHLRRASTAMMSDLSTELGAAALRPVQFAILSLVADNDGISQTALCRALSVQKANMVPLIAELERGGLLARRPADWDRRVQLLRLTEEAEARLPGWRKLVAKHEARFFKPLTAAERGEMSRMLRKLWVEEGTESPATPETLPPSVARKG